MLLCMIERNEIGTTLLMDILVSVPKNLKREKLPKKLLFLKMGMKCWWQFCQSNNIWSSQERAKVVKIGLASYWEPLLELLTQNLEYAYQENMKI